MKTICNIKEGVLSLLDKNCINITSKWDFIEKGKNDMTDIVTIDGNKYPLFYWKADPQIEAVARNAKKNIGGSISLKVSGLIDKSYGIDAFLYKELDIAEWVLDSKIKKITAYINKNAINTTLLMENGKVALLELGSSLKEGTEEQTRYTAWGKEGMESSRVVSTKTRPQSIYLYTDNTDPYCYNDPTLELFGLKIDDATKAVAIYKALKKEVDIKMNIERDKTLKFYIEKVYESANKNECVFL